MPTGRNKPLVLRIAEERLSRANRQRLSQFTSNLVRPYNQAIFILIQVFTGLHNLKTLLCLIRDQHGVRYLKFLAVISNQDKRRHLRLSFDNLLPEIVDSKTATFIEVRPIGHK